MVTPLRLLILEDSPSDAEMVLHTLRCAGYDPVSDRVETEQDFRDHLQPVPDIILADFSMPQFDSLSALAIMQECQLDIPFIIVSGTIGEERAVQAMQQGASDYIIKDRLGRLGHAVAHALEKKAMRHEKRLAERRLAAQHAITQALADSPTLIAACSHILRAICPALSWDFGALWQVDQSDNVLRRVESWRNSLVPLAAFEALDRQDILAPGLSFPERIREGGKPVWIADVARDPKFSSPAFDKDHVGMHGAFGLPILLGAETLAVLEFHSRERKEPAIESLEMMVTVGSQIRQFLERKRTEAERDRLLQKLQVQIERMPLAFFLMDSGGQILDWNPAAARIFGYAREEALGKSVFDLIVPASAREHMQTIILRLLAGDMTAHNTNENRTKDGRIITCDWFNTPLLTAEGAGGSIFSMGLDVTERVRLEEQFRQSHKMEAVGQLAAGVAHDFNNLLTIILGYSELLLAELPADDPKQKPVVQICQAADRAADLTRQLLAFARKQILAPIVLDFNALVIETEKMLQRVIGANIELTTILQPDLGRIKADPGQVEQLIMNLVVNARDAMPAGGHITIQTSNSVLTEMQVREHRDLLPGSYSLLTISDTGSGMDEETKARIFEPFFTTKEVGKGTGLGLATVFGIIKQSGGFIEVETVLGKGSTFRTYFPQTSEVVRNKGSDHGLIKMSKGRETILLVEDEDALRELAQLVLEASGYKVISSRNGDEAIQVCHNYGDVVHLLFTDVVMPKMSGQQLADILAPSRPHMKVLFMSGYTDDSMVRNGIQDGATNFLVKPYTSMALAEKVREVLDGRNAQQPVAIGGNSLAKANLASASCEANVDS